jgi:hypothetical protein
MRWSGRLTIWYRGCLTLVVVGCSALQGRATITEPEGSGGNGNEGGGPGPGGAGTGGSRPGPTGGATGSTGGSPGTGGVMMPPPRPMVGKCDGLGAVGEWQDITPPGVPLTGDFNYGVNEFVTDPLNHGTVYLGTSSHGIWKTSDCGASWVHINTGRNGAVCGADNQKKPCAEILDTGRQWAFEIDPYDSRILYTNNGYGSGTAGALKSTNGGVDWEQIWPGKDPALNKIAPDFVGLMRLDPGDHNHLIISFHAKCTGVSESCLIESRDAGVTWRVVWGKPGWKGGEGQFIWLLDGTRWLFGSESNGLWRTDDAGATWQMVLAGSIVGHSSGQLYRSKTGSFYLGTSKGVVRSTDGLTWALVPNSGESVGGVIGNGTTLFSSSYAVGFHFAQNLHPYYTSPESDGLTWTQMKSPNLTQGGWFHYDESHHLLYSSACTDGFWRVVTH